MFTEGLNFGSNIVFLTIRNKVVNLLVESTICNVLCIMFLPMTQFLHKPDFSRGSGLLTAPYSYFPLGNKMYSFDKTKSFVMITSSCRREPHSLMNKLMTRIHSFVIDSSWSFFSFLFLSSSNRPEIVIILSLVLSNI